MRNNRPVYCLVFDCGEAVRPPCFCFEGGVGLMPAARGIVVVEEPGSRAARNGTGGQKQKTKTKME